MCANLYNGCNNQSLMNTYEYNMAPMHFFGVIDYDVAILLNISQEEIMLRVFKGNKILLLEQFQYPYGESYIKLHIQGNIKMIIEYLPNLKGVGFLVSLIAPEIGSYVGIVKKDYKNEDYEKFIMKHSLENTAAQIIQEQWKACRYNPKFNICKKILGKEWDDISKQKQ